MTDERAEILAAKVLTSGFGLAVLHEEGRPRAYDPEDDGIALFGASHPVDTRPFAGARIWWHETWFAVRVRIGFGLVAIAERISPVRPYENEIDL